MIRKRENIQWAAVVWMKMPCWCQRPEENGQTVTNKVGVYLLLSVFFYKMWLNITLRLYSKKAFTVRKTDLWAVLELKMLQTHIIVVMWWIRPIVKQLCRHQRSCSRSGETAPAEWAGCSRNAIAVLWCHTWQWSRTNFLTGMHRIESAAYRFSWCCMKSNTSRDFVFPEHDNLFSQIYIT